MAPTVGWDKTYKIGAPIRCQPIIEGGRIYVGTDNGIDNTNKEFTGLVRLRWQRSAHGGAE
jgi:outer membrane protein assembly factor BamB